MKTIYKKLLFLLLLLPATILAQSSLDGVVLDSKTKQPVPGVNVIIDGTTNGTSTDFDGKFKLSNLKNGDNVVFSFIGYKSETINFSGQKSVSVSLQEESNVLQEVVVQVGYGNVKKKDATGSVTLVTAKDFNKGSITNATNLINGKVAGVSVNAGGGAPGSGTQIRIRGGSSLFGNNDPLVVIDGLPIIDETAKGSTSALASINPNDIESFSILKDASATAIYGARAANGVIIITTKKGTKKLAVDYNFQYGSGKLIDKINVFSADEFRNLINSRFSTNSTTDVAARAQLGSADTNWQNEIYRRTDFVDNNVSVRGNLFKTIPTRFSVGNTYEEGLRLTNNFNRTTVSTTMNPSFLKDHLKFRLSANYTNEKNRFADGVEGSALRFNPTQPVYDKNSPFGGFYEYRVGNSLADLTPNSTRNPVAQLLQTYDRGNSDRFYGSFETDYKFHFLPELRAVINVGFDESNGQRLKQQDFNAATSPRNGNTPFGKYEYESSRDNTKLLDAYLNYRKNIGKLNLDITAGYSYQKFESKTVSEGNIFDPNLPANFPETNTVTDLVLIGFFGRAVFNYNDKYLFTANFRRDGSSRFPDNNKYLNTPGLAFAWKLKEEFFKSSNLISDLKLRIGYGVTGQQKLRKEDNNIYLQQYGVGGSNSQYYFGTVTTPIGISKPTNPFLKWEETTTYNAGLDYGFNNNRLSGAVDVFYKLSDELFSDAPLPDGGNFSNRIVQNIGSFTTKGIEFSLNAEIIKSTNFNWNVNFNATKYERRIEELALGQSIPIGDIGVGVGGTAQVHQQSFTPFSFYVYKQLYTNGGQPIEGAYADLNGDGIINGNDRYIYKNPDPDALLGFSSSMNYKNFDFSFNVRASIGNRVYNTVNAGRAQYDLLRDGTVLGNVPTSVLDTNFNTTSDVILSDLYIENASFLKLDNVTIGYTFPKWLEGKASIRLFGGVQNAFTITKYSGLDPEINNEGRDNTIYPRQRQVLVGANVKF